MKLVTRTIIYYLLVSVPLLLIAVFFSYRMIRSELKDGTDEDLQAETENAEKMLNASERPDILYLSFDSLSSIRRVEAPVRKKKYSDTSIYNAKAHTWISYRMLRTPLSAGPGDYLITVLKPTLEEDELVEGLLSSFALVTGFLALSFFIVNWQVSKNLWKPFYATLAKLNNYEIKDHQKYTFDQSRITEFSQLNAALNKMTDKLYNDFLQQKEFTENAAHELQTPLAVIKANLSLLMQSPQLGEAEMNQLQAIEQTTKKLSSLNRALLLLAKIENNQFAENEPVHLKNLLGRCLDNFADLMQAKDITLQFESSREVVIHVNPILAEVLLTNLIQNAIRHNHQGGRIQIVLQDRKLIIANSGHALSVQPDELFKRFKKNDASRDSIGLGLAIVRSILSIYGYQITYSYPGGLHTFTVSF